MQNSFGKKNPQRRFPVTDLYYCLECKFCFCLIIIKLMFLELNLCVDFLTVNICKGNFILCVFYDNVIFKNNSCLYSKIYFA